MRDFLVVRGRSITFAALIVSLLISFNLFLHNNIYLLAAVACGYGAAIYYFFMLAMRLNKSMSLSAAAARRSMQFGLILRFVFFLLFSLIILKLSKVFFIAFIAGFFIMYIVLFINLIIFSYRKNLS